jgi:hypothetical protein
VSRLLPAWVAIVAVMTGGARAVWGDVDGARFESTEWKVRLTAPRNWQLTERTSYPNVLLWMAHPPDARMLLSAEYVSDGETAASYAARTSKLLETIGFKLRAPQVHSATGAFWIDFDNGKSYLREAFLVIGNIGYALTLSAPDSRRRSQNLRAFDYALRSIRPIRGAGQSKPTDGPGRSGIVPEDGATDVDANDPTPDGEL